MNEDDKNKSLSDFARYSNMGIQMLAIILIAVYAGIKLDSWLHNKFKLFTILFTIFSVFIAVYHAIKDLIKK